MDKVQVVEKSLQERWDEMTVAEQQAVKALHVALAELKADPDRYIEMGVDPVRQVVDIEYTLQGLWKFSRDAAYHIHWMDLKGCTCPKLDNVELFGFDQRVNDSKCKWHGEIVR